MLAAALPDLESLDVEALKALVIAQHERYTRTLNSRAGEIERLMLLVAKLNQMLFGRKSEKVLRQIEQLEFQLEDLQAASAVEEVQAAAAAERPAVAKPRRRPLPEHLPREVHTHMPGHVRVRRARARSAVKVAAPARCGRSRRSSTSTAHGVAP